MSEPEWVTIAEAARRLGLAERQARRWADRLPADAKRQEEIAHGRTRALVQLAALKHLFEADGVRSNDRTSVRTASEPMPERETTVSEPSYPVPLALAMTAQRDALERVMLEKERVISEQAARINDLQAALDHERESGRRLGEALAREQTLRMLERPSAEPMESPGENGLKMPVEAPESPRGVGRSGAPGPDPPQIKPSERIRAFWKRAWQSPEQ